MEFLKNVFGDKALTFADFKAALEADKSIKLANLADGKYVDKDTNKLTINNLIFCNTTIVFCIVCDENKKGGFLKCVTLVVIIALGL